MVIFHVNVGACQETDIIIGEFQVMEIIVTLSKAKSEAENAGTGQIKIIALAEAVSFKTDSMVQGDFTSSAIP